MDLTFSDWREANPLIDKSLFFPDGEDCRWGRVRANWKEKGKNGADLSHICAFALDLQTGDLYLDCDQRKIWAKCVVLSVARPFFGLLKTGYHLLLPLSLSIETFKAIFNGIIHNHSSREIVKAVWCHTKFNIADIVRTPLYTIAITITTTLAAIIGPFEPLKLYELRAVAGRLERALNRGENSFWTLAPCFQPLGKIQQIHKDNYQKLDTEYEDEPTLHGLNNLARNYIKFRRENRNPFNDCGALLSEDQPYISTAYSTEYLFT